MRVARSAGAGRAAARQRALPRRRRFHPRRQAGRGAAGDGSLRAPARHHAASGQSAPTISAASRTAHAARSTADVAIAADRPAVQVSWRDADAYAAWLSRQTGETYRLPTDEEWAYAAGSRYQGRRPAGRRQRSRRAAGSPATNARLSLEERRGDGAAAAVRRLRRQRERACSTSPAMSGNGPAPASCAPRSTTRGEATVAERRIAACACRRPAPRLRHATSSATRAPADARPAFRRAISDSGWCASRHRGCSGSWPVSRGVRSFLRWHPARSDSGSR